MDVCEEQTDYNVTTTGGEGANHLVDSVEAAVARLHAFDSNGQSYVITGFLENAVSLEALQGMAPDDAENFTELSNGSPQFPASNLVELRMIAPDSIENPVEPMAVLDGSPADDAEQSSFTQDSSERHDVDPGFDASETGVDESSMDASDSSDGVPSPNDFAVGGGGDVVQSRSDLPLIIQAGSDVSSFIEALESGNVSNPQVASIMRSNGLKGKGSLQVITVGNKALICAKLGDLRRPKTRIQCTVHGCQSTPSSAKHLTFFRYPKQRERGQSWSKFTRSRSLRMMAPEQLYNGNLRMCSAHFKITDFLNPYTRNRLTPTAVPSVFDSSKCPWFHDEEYVPDIPKLFDPLSALVRNADVGNGFTEGMDLCADTDKVDPSDLCEYHSLLVKSVTVVGTEMCDVKFCVRCGDAVLEPVQLVPNVFQIQCRRGHAIVATTEFSERCRDWIIACQNRHRKRGASDPPCHSPCHLCDDHYCPPHEFRPPPPLPLAAPGGDAADPSQPDRKRRGRKPKRRRTVKQTKLPSAFPPLVRSAFRFAVTADAAVSCGSGGASDAIGARERLMNTYRNSKQTQLAEGCLKSTRETERLKLMRKMRSRIVRLEKQVDVFRQQAEHPDLDDDVVLKRVLPKYLSGAALKLTETQVLLAVHQGENMHWPPSVVALAKVVHHESPFAYGVLRQIWRLPSPKSIRRLPLPPAEFLTVRSFLRRTFGTTRSDDGAERKSDELRDCAPPPTEAVADPLAIVRVESVAGVADAAPLQSPFPVFVDGRAEEKEEPASDAMAADGGILDRAVGTLHLDVDDGGGGGAMEQEAEQDVPGDGMMVIEMPDELSQLSGLGVISTHVQEDGTCVYQILADPSELQGEDVQFHMVAPLMQPYELQETGYCEVQEELLEDETDAGSVG